MKDKLYLPSNGTEGEGFMEDFCYKCSKEKRCPILLKTMTVGHVPQWIYVDDEPTCTAFKAVGTKYKKRTIKNHPKLF